MTEKQQPNPLREGLSTKAVPQPCAMVIFGWLPMIWATTISFLGRNSYYATIFLYCVTGSKLRF